MKSNRREVAAVESLEGRGYLSADLASACVSAVPSASATSVKATARASARISPSKVKAAPAIDLTPHITGIVHRSKNALYIVVGLVVNNAGPTVAKGSLRISIEFSYYNTGASARLFKTINTPIKIAAGGSKTIKIGGAIPKSYPAFDYHMVAILNGKKTIPETDYANDTEVTRSYFYLA